MTSTASRTTSSTASSEHPAPRRRRWGSLTDGPSVRVPVFVASGVGVLAMAAWAIAAPTQAQTVIGDGVAWVVGAFGWFYIALTTAVLVFVVYLALSRYGSVRLGPDDSRPEFSTFAWASMLFAAGIGTDVMFFAVAEPVTQYMAPPTGTAQSIEAARDATVWTLFHYGISGWGLYALMGLALGYFSYRLNLPLAVRSALHPIFGRRIDGALGHTVDTAAVLGTIFGVATSLGIGVVFLNQGLNVLFDVPVGLGAQIALIVLAVAIAAVSATTGVDKGIRFLSQLNVILALALAGWVLITGRTGFILNAVVMNVGDYVQTFASRTMETFAFSSGTSEWMSLWTLFFWAWWVAWASFVGVFLARISRGRTIRQFVAGTLIIPFVYVVMWISIFGNAALERIRGGDAAFAQTALDSPESGFYALLQDYPLSGVVIALSVFVGLLFYVTSADSGALVMANLSSNLRSVQDDAAPWLRITWAAATGLLTIAVLAVGGIYALQNATVIFGLPFAFVIVLVMIGLLKALRAEGRRVDAGVEALPAEQPERDGEVADAALTSTWKARLARAVSFVDVDEAGAYLGSVVRPALDDVARELCARSVPADVSSGGGDGDGAGLPWVRLATAGDQPFVYRVQVAEAPVPTYGGRIVGDRDRYARLEVHTADGSQSHDVMGQSAAQVIHDCLDRYERHLELLRLA